MYGSYDTYNKIQETHRCDHASVLPSPRSEAPSARVPTAFGVHTILVLGPSDYGLLFGIPQSCATIDEIFNAVDVVVRGGGGGGGLTPSLLWSSSSIPPQIASGEALIGVTFFESYWRGMSRHVPRGSSLRIDRSRVPRNVEELHSPKVRGTLLDNIIKSSIKETIESHFIMNS